MIGSSNTVDESPNLSLENSNESGSSSRIVMATPNELVPPKWAGTKLLSEEGRVYQKIKDGLPPIMKNRVTITAIHLCMRRGPVEESGFEVYLENVKKVTRARGRRVDSAGWYGTSAKNVDSLMRRGFEMNSIVPASYPHGVGIYLSHFLSPQISDMMSDIDENGEKHTVLCQFILGNSEKVELGSKQLFPSSADFDTGVDDLTNPKVYVDGTPVEEETFMRDLKSIVRDDQLIGSIMLEISS
ncbi:probable inactive poly [ADP-ribose] polymerase SRO2 [Solanum pennellii]|uniref:Probable inactive poly [ADP-ribose] polymerase SRO2 n=1 Tax=Solanum pennellii TaxID=28526 RepID=A0ABM1GLB9_SOLPN|nr:probable inactive poly [ADP-ribose] polymerase SRO2 [Solanum pennellii]